MLDYFDRPSHRKLLPGRGVLMLFLAVTILLIFFEKNIVLASIMIWTLGDSVSALVGKHYGSTKHPLNNNRLIEGTIAGIICGALGAMLFVPWQYALVAAIIAMSLESLEIKFFEHDVDDNFLVPIASALVMLLLGMI